MSEYSGYEAFEYLEEGEDYKSFSLPDQIHNGEPYEVPLEEDEEQRAEELGENSIVISFHEHPFYFPREIIILEEVRRTIPE